LEDLAILPKKPKKSFKERKPSPKRSYPKVDLTIEVDGLRKRSRNKSFARGAKKPLLNSESNSRTSK
jgi:hypothetical protein